MILLVWWFCSVYMQLENITGFYLRRFIWISILGNPQPRLSQCFGLSQCTPVSNKPVTVFFCNICLGSPICEKYVFWASLKFPLFCERAFQAKLPAFLYIQRLNFHCNGVFLQRVIWPLLQLLPATLHVTTHYITPPTLYHPSHNYNYNYITPPTKNITSPLPQLFAPIFLPQIYFSKLIPMHQKFTPDTTRGTADPDYWVRNLSSDQTYKNNWEYSIILRLVPFLLIVCLLPSQKVLVE